MAAVLACGSGSALCGPAAAHHLVITKGKAPKPEVVSPADRRVTAVVTHRTRSGPSPSVTTWRGIPTTTVPQTLVDLAACLALDDLARACHEAQVLHRTTPAMVEAILERRPTSTGAGNLRRVLRGDLHITLSELERRFVALMRRHGFPLPETNRPAGSRYVDCRWPEVKLTVELDSYRFHNSRHTWELDRRREREAYARGDQFRRYTWHDVTEDPALMLAELRSLLSVP